jgi:transcription elongation factor Elf1
MAAKTTLSSAPPRVSERRVSRPFTFGATCPICGQERVQYAYMRRALLRLLEKGQIIDAHCGTCDVVWAVTPQERVVLARAILATAITAGSTPSRTL